MSISTNKAIYDILATTGCVVVFHYPTDFVALPCISYFLVANVDTVRADDVEYAASAVYQIDIWAKKADQVEATADSVRKKLGAAGYKRQFCTDMFDAAAGVYRKCMRYAAVEAAV